MRARCLILLFLLNGCCFNTKPWVLQKARGDCYAFCAASLKHLPENDFNAIELQLLQGCFGLRGFLSVRSGCIPPLANNPEVCLVWIGVGQHDFFFFEASLLEGSQKAILPKEATRLIVESLLSTKQVSIGLEGYCALLHPGKFCRLYQALPPD